MLVIILGPTASGKTAAAIEVAERLGTEVISADSRQFYNEMRIGTARPSDEELARVRHHFIGHLSVRDYYNVARFEADALRVLQDVFRNGQYAVMAGGSGLYIDAVCKGIDDLPDPDPELRKKLKDEYHSEGMEYLQRELFQLDPEYYRMVDLQNPNRLLRAIEVSLLTGKPYSSFRKKQPRSRDFRILKFGLDIPREVLFQRIDERVDHMIENGLLEEVRSLIHYRNLNALNTVGYRELFDFLDGRMNYPEAVQRIKTNTRRYAKRQMTWFRKDNEITWVKGVEEIHPLIKSFSDH